MNDNLYSPEYLHQITINWSRPIAWNNVDKYNKDWDGGLYYITRTIHAKSGDSSTPIYIGKSIGKISKRVLSHSLNDSNCPFYAERGEFKVRFGRIVSPINYMKHYHFNRLLLTIESALIQEVKPKCNVSQKNQYTPWYDLRIISIGYRDRIPGKINNRDHSNILPRPKWWDGQF
ncbi:MAG: hypothetical protein IJK93_07875 [Muribaculaceae bacterium]|nr:hypothetical protein [Muribaculaceae bacterium]